MKCSYVWMGVISLKINNAQKLNENVCIIDFWIAINIDIVLYIWMCICILPHKTESNILLTYSYLPDVLYLKYTSESMHSANIIYLYNVIAERNCTLVHFRYTVCVFWCFFIQYNYILHTGLCECINWYKAHLLRIFKLKTTDI